MPMPIHSAADLRRPSSGSAISNSDVEGMAGAGGSDANHVPHLLCEFSFLCHFVLSFIARLEILFVVLEKFSDSPHLAVCQSMSVRVMRWTHSPLFVGDGRHLHMSSLTSRPGIASAIT